MQVPIYLALAMSLPLFCSAVPAQSDARAKRSISANPLISTDFADPSYVNMSGDGWWAFATSSGGKNIQMASSQAFDGLPWTVDPADPLPTVGGWSTGKNVWAPSVVQISPSSFVMYYSAQVSQNDNTYQCVGAANASSIKGPYTPQPSAFACPTEKGGAIDPSPFQDVNGTRYVVYKVDGNSMGSGGACGNSNEEYKAATPIWLQQVDASGMNPVGTPKAILTNDERDGPLVEAPSLSRVQDPSSAGGWLYYLFFSSGCYSDSSYDISYATSTNGIDNGGQLYEKAKLPLMQTGADGNKLYAPGGLYSDVNLNQNQYVVFHADQGTSSDVRPMWGGTLVVEVANRTIQLDTPASGINV